MTDTPIISNSAARIEKSVISHLNKVLNNYRKSTQIILFFTGNYKWYLFVLLFFSIMLGLMETFQIILLYPILTASFNLQDQGIWFIEVLYNFVHNFFNFPDVVAFSLLFILFVFLTFIVTLIYKYLSLNLTKMIIIKTKESIFDKLVENDYRYFVDTRRGDVLYAVVTAPARIRSFLENTTAIFSDLVVIFIILIMMLLISPSGVAILICSGIFFVLIIRIVGKKVAYRLGKLQLQSLQSENEIISGYIQGLRQIRSVHGDEYWKEKYNIALRNYWDKYIKFSFIKNLPAATLNFFLFSAIAGVVIISYYLFVENFIFIIPLLATIAFSAIKILPRLANIGNQYMNIMDDYPNLEKIYRFLKDSRFNTLKNGSKLFDNLKSDIVFKNVDFAYHKNQMLLNTVNLNIKKKKITALVGHSGSGKSTIVSLLLRYYDVTNGSILINGYDLREYDLKTILRKVGYVSQDTFIYNTSIRENISFGGVFSDEQIIRAAKKANIHEYISNLPNGYDNIVGDQGLKLSGGEKQRIAIARALVRDPEILILDEATSNLDNESEAIVQDSINQVSENITTFVIAHRLSTIRNADMIYIMSKGKILESGNHNELMEMRGKYYELYISAE